MITELIISIVYRFLTLLVGVYLIERAYKLSKAQAANNAGEINATWGTFALILKKNPQSVIFLTAGVFVISASIFKGVSLNSSQKKTTEKGSIDLAVDSLPVKITTRNFNADSIYKVTQQQMDASNYQKSLKYLYILQGFYLGKSSDSIKLVIVENDIKTCERLINAVNKEKKTSETTEETKSTNIHSNESDSIR